MSISDLVSQIKLLAERVESLVSQEHAKWIALQEQAGKDQSTKRQ